MVQSQTLYVVKPSKLLPKKLLNDSWPQYEIETLGSAVWIYPLSLPKKYTQLLAYMWLGSHRGKKFNHKKSEWIRSEDHHCKT